MHFVRFPLTTDEFTAFFESSLPHYMESALTLQIRFIFSCLSWACDVLIVTQDRGGGFNEIRLAGLN